MIPDSVQITEDVRHALKGFIHANNYSNVAVLVDEHTEEFCLPEIRDALPEHWLIKIASGEEQKILSTCELIWESLTETGFDRNGLMINLGGGVIGDMGGFCAATFKRGIDFVNIPTTLLAQVDASVGGKVGIDFNGLKNHLGAFRDPELVIVHPKFLDTLPERELRSGYAEVIKHALIADADYWEVLRAKNFEQQDWASHIDHSIQVKSKIVEDDPLEKGLRKLLNFGHTIGHAIETTYLNEGKMPLLHGEAVAIGMMCEAFISSKKCGLPDDHLDQISSFLITTFEPVKIEKNKFEEILALCRQDKKNLGNVINCTLLKQIGEGMVNVPVSEGEILDAMFFYNQLSDK